MRQGNKLAFGTETDAVFADNAAATRHRKTDLAGGTRAGDASAIRWPMRASAPAMAILTGDCAMAFAYFHMPRMRAPMSTRTSGRGALPCAACTPGHDICWNAPRIEAGMKRVREA